MGPGRSSPGRAAGPVVVPLAWASPNHADSVRHDVPVDGAPDLASVRRALEAAGCVAATDEAEELIRTARGGSDLEGMLQRRLGGEPLEWITGRASFCGLTVPIGPGVYVPRWQSEPLARMAARLLPPNGLAVDLATGSGAIALAVRAARPGARIVGTEIDPVAARWARANGVVVYEGNLDEALPADLASRVDVMIGVLPYVPTDAFGTSCPGTCSASSPGERSTAVRGVSS